MSNIIKIASLQTKVSPGKFVNIDNLADIFGRGLIDGSDIVSLPEMWNCPYQTEMFPKYAELEGGDTWQRLASLARKNKVYIVGGTIPERDAEGRIYNTCYVFNRDGEQIGKHRKVHLFDIYSHGKPVFRESDTLTAGDCFGSFETEWGLMGINICFDIRFPESARILALKGAKVIFNPAAFNMKTGPAHWELGFRQRAVENQLFMVGTAPARDPSAGYIAYGHSIITDPWGAVVMQMDEKPGVEITEIDLDYIDEIRERLPMIGARRTDVYKLEEI